MCAHAHWLCPKTCLVPTNSVLSPSKLQDGDWVCKHCSRLLVTADRVITTQHNSHNYTVGKLPETNAQDKTAAQQDGLLVKPQRWMGGSMSAADGDADSKLHCPK